MVLIYPDTNALWGDPFLQSDRATRMFEALESVTGKLIISPVVLEELNNRTDDAVSNLEATVASKASAVAHLFGMREPNLVTAARGYAEELRSIETSLRDTMLENDLVEVLP